MAKRNCRRTAEERDAHTRAVAIRKMTDEQLCAYVDNEIAETGEAEYKRGYSDGYSKGTEDAATKRKNSAMEFILRLQSEKRPGFGAITISRLMEAANEYGYC